MGKKQTITPPKQYDDFFKAFEDIKNNPVAPGSGLAGAMAPTYRGTNTGHGESIYDESFNWNADADFQNLETSINENRAQEQPWINKAGAGIARVGTKAATEIAKLPGYIGGAIAAPFADENEGFNTAFNNQWVQTVDKFNQQINEDVLPVYVKDAVKNGNLWQNLSSIDFWATEGADGLGYIVSMLAPGAAIKGLGIAGKVAEGTQFLDKVLNAGGKLALGERAVANGLITTANTLAEAGSEAGSAMNSFTETKGKFTNDLIKQGYTPEEAEAAFIEQRGKLGRDMFLTNVAILALPNYINTKMLYGAGSKAVTRNIFDETGRLVSQIDQPSFLNRLYAGGKQFGSALASEGFFEEGLQSTAENFFKKEAGKNQLGKGATTDDFKNFGKEYLDVLTTTEGQKAIALGGLLGGPMQVIGDYKQTNRDIQSTNAYLNLLQQNSDIYLANNTNADIYKRTTFINPQSGEFEYELIDGKKVVDPVKLNNITSKAYNSSKFSEMFDAAQAINDKETLTALQRLSQDNLIIPMITGNEVGRDLLNEYLNSVEDISKEDKSAMLKKADKLQLTHDQFIDLGIKPTDLGDSNIDIQDKLDYHKLLNNSLLVNESQKLSLQSDLEANNEKMKEIFTSKNLAEVFNDQENLRQINQEISKDVRLEKLNKEIIKIQEDLLRVNKQSENFWDKNKNKKAFSDFLKQRNTLREKNSQEKLDAANEVSDKIANATTVDEVNEAITPTAIKVETSENPATPTNVEEVSQNVPAPIDTLDSQTQEILKEAASNKIGEIAVKTEEDIIEANNQVVQEKSKKNDDLFEALKANPLGEPVDGKNYQYLNLGEKHAVIVNGNYEDVKTFESEEEAKSFIFGDEIETVETEDLDYHEPQTQIEFEPSEDEPDSSNVEYTNAELEQVDDKEELSDDSKTPTAKVLGVNKDGSPFQYASPEFHQWLNTLKNKVGTPVGFSIGERSEYGSNKNSVEAVQLFIESKDFKFRNEELQKLIQYLPLKVLINNQSDTYSFIPTISFANPDINNPTYIARKNIITAITNAKGTYFNEKLKNTKSKIQYQKSGLLNYVKPETTLDVNGNKISVLLETKIQTLDEFNNDTSKVPLFFVKDDFNIMDEKGENTVFPSTLTSGQNGYIYTLIHSTNGMKVPVKMNTFKLQEEHADLIYNTYQTLYDKNRTSNVKRNQYITKLVDLFAENPELESQIKNNFQKELNLFKSLKDITVADFMTLFMHDNLNFDGTTKPYTTKFKGAGITFGQDSFVNFSRESEEYKNAFKDFIVNQKRQNVKLDFLVGVNKNINSQKYKSYILENVLSTNIDPTKPFKGDNNVFIDTAIDINPEPEVTQIITENNKVDNLYKLSDTLAHASRDWSSDNQKPANILEHTYFSNDKTHYVKTEDNKYYKIYDSSFGYVGSVQNISEEVYNQKVKNKIENTRNSEINPLSLSSAFSEDELFNLSEDDFSDLDETPPTKC